MMTYCIVTLKVFICLKLLQTVITLLHVRTPFQIAHISHSHFITILQDAPLQPSMLSTTLEDAGEDTECKVP